MKIAIIGSGAAGLMAGLSLKKMGHNITIFEKDDHIGGHAKCVSVPLDHEESLIVDLGVILLHPEDPSSVIGKCLREIPVEMNLFPVEHSFQNDKYDLVWCTNSPFKGNLRKGIAFFNGLRNALKRRSIKKTFSYFQKLNKFFKSLDNIRSNEKYRHMNLKEFCEAEGYDQSFIDNWFFPQLFCWWGVGTKGIPSANIFTLSDTIHMFANNDQYRFKGGFSSFVKKYFASLLQNIETNTCVSSVNRTASGVEVEVNGKKRGFDRIIFATPPKIVEELLQNKSDDESQIFKEFETITTTVYLHNDRSWMPKDAEWSAANIVQDKRGAFATTWFGFGHPKKPDIFVTSVDESINTPAPKEYILKETFTRISPTGGYSRACQDINTIQGKGNVWYCGAHVHALGEKPPSIAFDNALKSGLQAAEMVHKSTL